MGEFVPPKVWVFDAATAYGTNTPTAGPRVERALPVGKHKIQLYSMATPNGVKVTIMLEELLEAGVKEADYDAWFVGIGSGDQFGSDFTAINPNSKIPALVDSTGDKPLKLFESGAMLLHLAEKFGKFVPTDAEKRAQCLCWLFWQMGSAPYLGGGFGHFYHYAKTKQEYPINRFTMEVKRQLDLLNKHLAENKYICGDQYTIADMAIFPWYGILTTGTIYNAQEFLQVQEYEHVIRWAKEIDSRPAVIRGKMVNRTWGDEREQLKERHDASDFLGKAA